MNRELQDLLSKKKHNRRIIERAYNKSSVNSQYVFPISLDITKYEQDSDISDLISLKSRVSQIYDLNQQNIKKNPENQNSKSRKIIHISKLLSKRKQTISDISKMKNQKESQKDPKEQNFDVRKPVFDQKLEKSRSNSKRQFLSLTPNKQRTFQNQGLNNQSIKSYTVQKDTKLHSSFNTQSSKKRKSFIIKGNNNNNQTQNSTQFKISKLAELAEQIFNKLKQTASKCLSLQKYNINSQSLKAKDQITFIDSQEISFTKESFSKRISSKSSKTSLTKEFFKIKEKNSQFTADSSSNTSLNIITFRNITNQMQSEIKNSKRSNRWINITKNNQKNDIKISQFQAGV